MIPRTSCSTNQLKLPNCLGEAHPRLCLLLIRTLQQTTPVLDAVALLHSIHNKTVSRAHQPGKSHRSGHVLQRWAPLGQCSLHLLQKSTSERQNAR